jgi:transcriptional regulator GlxA family with amidase domain
MAPPSGKGTVQRMVDFIESGYVGRIKLKIAAASVRGNPAEVGRSFRAKMRVSVHRYFTQLRLEHAADLISSNIKVEAVALGVGYRSKKNCVLQFARTPEAFRKRHAVSRL